MNRQDVIPASGFALLGSALVAGLHSGAVSVDQLAALLASVGTPAAIVLLGWMYRPTVDRALTHLCERLGKEPDGTP